MLKKASEKIGRIADRLGNIEIGGWCFSALSTSIFLIDSGANQLLGQDADPKRLIMFGGAGVLSFLGTLGLEGVRSGYRRVSRVLDAESRLGYLQERDVSILESSKNLNDTVSAESGSALGEIGAELICAKIAYDRLPEDLPMGGRVATCSILAGLAIHRSGNTLGSRLALRMANKLLKPAVDRAFKEESAKRSFELFQRGD